MNDQDLRISDAEREQAATDLGEHYAQGRLTTEEHRERLDQIWAARTRGELAPIFADLPGRTFPAAAARALAGPAPARAVGGASRSRCSCCSAVLVAVAVVTDLPLILIGLAVWFLLVRRGSCAPRSHRYHQARY